MDKIAYLLDPIMIAAVIIAVLAAVIFFVIALKARSLKSSCACSTGQAVSGEPEPRSKQQTAEYKVIDFEPDSFAQKHWGNLSIEERYSMLLPESKVLYVAAKKQLDASKLTNHQSKICEIYFAENTPAARLLIYRGLIYLFLNINPASLDKNIYGHEDVSDKEGYEMLPTMIIIKESAQIDKIPGLIDLIS